MIKYVILGGQLMTFRYLRIDFGIVVSNANVDRK